MEKNEYKKVSIKNGTCYQFDGIIKLEDFYFSNILINEKSHENIYAPNLYLWVMSFHINFNWSKALPY